MLVNYDDFVDTSCGVCKKQIELFEKYQEVNALMVCETCYYEVFGDE